MARLGAPLRIPADASHLPMAPEAGAMVGGRKSRPARIGSRGGTGMAFPAAPECFYPHRPPESGTIEGMALPATEGSIASMLMVAVAASRRHIHMCGMVEFHRLVPVGEASQGHGLRHDSFRGRGRGGSAVLPRTGRKDRGNAGPDKEHDCEEHPFSHFSCPPLRDGCPTGLPHWSSFSASSSLPSSFFSFFSLLPFFPPRYASVGLHPKKAVLPATPRSLSNISNPVRNSSVPRA